jgi:hypothetical protein
MFIEESRQYMFGLSFKEMERDVLFCKGRRKLLQSSEHEAVLAQRSMQKPRDETEEHDQRGLCSDGLFLREKQRPVVIGPLVPAHPIDYGPLPCFAVFQQADSFRVKRHNVRLSLKMLVRQQVVPYATSAGFSSIGRHAL